MAENQTILIVDDEEPIRQLLKYNLEREGYTTFQAGTEWVGPLSHFEK